MIFLIAGGALRPVHCVHIRGANAPHRIRLQALQGIRIEEHSPPHGIGVAKFFHNGRAISNAQFRQRRDNGRPPFLRRRHFESRHRQRLDVNDILRRRRLNFQIDEIRFSLGMVQRPPDERGGILPQFFLR